MVIKCIALQKPYEGIFIVGLRDQGLAVLLLVGLKAFMQLCERFIYLLP